MENDFFDRCIRIDELIKRNIVFIPPISEIANSLSDEEDFSETLIKAIQRGREYLNKSEPSNDFYYTTAIEYPFKTEPFMSSRYTDGSYPVWYGSKTLDTTIYETVYHTIKYITSIENYEKEEVIIRKRAIYNVHCNAILIDLLGKEKKHPALIDNGYSFTQKIGKSIREGGYPGLQSPSVRRKNGININIFKQRVLSQPVLERFLSYQYNAQKSELKVFFENAQIMSFKGQSIG